MKFALPALGGRRPRTHWQLLLGAAIWTIVGCQSAEPYRLGGDKHDALPSPTDTAGSGGAGSALETNGGTGGELPGTGGAGGSGTGGFGTGGFGTGGFGTGGFGTGGSSNPGTGGLGTGGLGTGGSGTGGASTGGSGGIVPDASPGSGGSTQPDASGTVDSSPGVSPFCQRTGWTATASVMSTGSTRPAAGIDGDLTTRWANGHFQDGTDWYKVDFGGLVRLDTITLDNSQSYPGDWPGAYAVFGSTDGTTFTASFASGFGAEGKTVIQFAPQTVRAIRINQAGASRKTNWWQIGELQIHCLM